LIAEEFATTSPQAEKGRAGQWRISAGLEAPLLVAKGRGLRRFFP
jgi:hypothetical protein